MNCGHLDISGDGSRVLMAVTRSGLVWEIDLRTGEVLWEYIYVHPNAAGEREAINTAKYVSAAGAAGFLSPDRHRQDQVLP
jgi:hypothetical protein